MEKNRERKSSLDFFFLFLKKRKRKNKKKKIKEKEIILCIKTRVKGFLVGEGISPPPNFSKMTS